MVGTKENYQSATNFYFDRLLLLKVYEISAKRYMRLMSHDTKDWCKIWRKTDLLFQKLQEFGEFWPELLKFSKFLLWLIPFVHLTEDSPDELSFMTLKKDARFEEKLTCGLENNIRHLTNFHQSTWKISKLGLCWGPFIQSRKCMSLKFTGELCVMTKKNDGKFDKDMTCPFKTEIRNLTNFDPTTQKSKKFAL